MPGIHSPLVIKPWEGPRGKKKSRWARRDFILGVQDSWLQSSSEITSHTT